MPSESLSTKSLLLEQILHETPSSSEALPTLNPPPSWWADLFQKWLDKTGEWLMKLLKTIFKSDVGISLNYELPKSLPQLIVHIVVALVVGYLLFRLIRTLMQMNRRSSDLDATIQVPPWQELDRLIDLALSQGRFDEALRARWKMFLYRRNVSPDLTPYEYSLGHNPLANSLLTGLYRIMFSGEGGTLESYRSVELALAQIEPQPRERP